MQNVRKKLRQCVGQPLVADVPAKAARGEGVVVKAAVYSPLEHIRNVVNSKYLLQDAPCSTTSR